MTFSQNINVYVNNIISLDPDKVGWRCVDRWIKIPKTERIYRNKPSSKRCRFSVQCIKTNITCFPTRYFITSIMVHPFSTISTLLLSWKDRHRFVLLILLLTKTQFFSFKFFYLNDYMPSHFTHFTGHNVATR